MARKKPMQYIPLEERPEFIAAMTALPADPGELEVRAERVLALYHDAMLAADVQALDDAHLVYEACVIKLNGGTNLGSATIEEALSAKFSAPAGHVPKWGQSGEFLLEVDGMRMVVKMGVGSLANHCGADLHAVDFDEPFVSDTGYHHLYMRPAMHVGRTVDQAVRADVLELLASQGKAKAINAEYREKKHRKVWKWLAEALSGMRADGQLAMFGDTPKDPNAKVPLSNAERQKALRERRKAQQLKPVMLTETERQWLEKLREQAGGEPVRGANGEFASLELTDASLLSVWGQLPTDFSRASTALGVLRLRNNQHAELVRAVELLQDRLRDAGLSDRVSSDKKEWYWNKSPLGDYRTTGAPEYMERLGASPSMADELAQLRRQVAALEEQKAEEMAARGKAFEAVYVLTNRLEKAGLPTDRLSLPGEPGSVTVTRDKG